MKNKLPSLIFTTLALSLCSCHSSEATRLKMSLITTELPTGTTALSGNFIWPSVMTTVVVLALALTVVCIVYGLNSGRWQRFWRHVEQRLPWFFVLTWLFGFYVYCLGMYVIDGADDTSFGETFFRILKVAPMCVIYTFGMFLFQSDISAVHHTFVDDVLYMMLFSLAHFFAAMVSLLFVIKHFGYNIVSKLRMWMTNLIGKEKHDLFIFWGQNEPSFYLAKSIKEEHKKEYRILFVRTEDSEEAEGNPTGFARLFNFLSLKNKDLEKLKDIGCLSVESFRRLSKCELTEEERENRNAQILRNKLSLRSVVRLLNHTQRLHIFMLGDDEEANIKATRNICHDYHLNDFAKKDGRNAIIYCHARYDSISRVIENEHFADNLEVRVIDSAHLAIETLKSSEKDLSQPVHFVDIRKDATVSSAFHSMVIGFGQCGRDAVKFLYEHGAFVERYDQSGSAVRSPFRCDVFDRNMMTIGSHYKSSKPKDLVSLVGQHDSLEIADKLLNLYDADINDQRFWDYVDAEITKQNYIVITLKDDEVGITLAVKLLKHAIRKGSDRESKDDLRKRMERFRIFVRSYSLELLPHIKAIARFYNDSVKKSLGLTENIEPICPFGSVEEIYTWKNIVDDSMQKESFRFYNNYEGIEEDEAQLGTAWAKRRKNELKEWPYGFANINSVRRKETQDMENAWHKVVKIHLARKAFNNDEAFMDCVRDIATEALVRYEYDALGNRIINEYQKPLKGVVYKQIHSQAPLLYTSLADSDQRKKIFDTLAQTEHLRWNASHELLGYVYGKKKDEVIMTHDCLTAWAKLKDDETRGYDYSVVDTSLKLYYQKKHEQR